MPGIPNSNVPIADPDGRVSDAWGSFFQDLVARPGRFRLVTPGPSPFTYSAPAGGFVSVVGGTVSAVSLVRGTNPPVTLPTGMTGGMFPVSTGDRLIITYSSAPAINFVPS